MADDLVIFIHISPGVVGSFQGPANPSIVAAHLPRSNGVYHRT